MDIQQEKKHLRHSMKILLADYEKNHQQCNNEEKQANQLLLDSPFYKEATSILVYAAMEKELSMDKIISKALLTGKTVAIPKCNSTNCTMDFFQLHPNISLENQLRSGTYGIREPVSSLPYLGDLKNKTLILIPGIAFTIQGHRLGQGKGFYDRYLEKLFNRHNRNNLLLMGVCYPIQLIEKIPTENTDVSVDYILTPTQIYSCINYA